MLRSPLLRYDHLTQAGARVTLPPLPTPPGDDVAPTGRVMSQEAWAQHGARITAARATADPGMLRRFETASLIDETAYCAAHSVREEDRRRFAARFEGADILITPATPRTAPPLAEVEEADFTLAHYTRMANYLDLCALALPCGFDRGGLPIGVQLVAGAGSEAPLLAAALAVERLLALPTRLPPLHVSRCVG